MTATGVILVARSLVGSRGSYLSHYWVIMAGKALLQTLCAPSPLALAASAALHAWNGDSADAAAALAFFVVKVAALTWTRHWTGAAVAEHGLEDAPGESERAAMAAGRGCLLAGAGLAFYLYLADPDESAPTRALGRSLVVFNISLLPGALPLALRLRLVQAATFMAGVARPRGLGLIERAARLQVLFVRDGVAFEAAGVRCVLLTAEPQADVEGPVVLAADMWPASHRRDRRLRECAWIASGNVEDIEEALLIASQGGTAVGIQLDVADAFDVPPDTLTFGERADVDFHTVAGAEGELFVLTQARHAAASLSLCSCVRLAACWHEAVVIAVLYAFARPLRTLDLVLIALVADSLLCSIRTGRQPADPEAPRGSAWAGALVHGTLMAGVTMTAHASPFFEGGGDQHGEYRSAALALQIVVSTALLPAATGPPWSLARWPVHLLLAAAISIAWGVLRISWLDVGLLWAWDCIGHLVIGLVGKRLL